MTYVSVESKISLINKYIQLNFLKSGGKSMHEDMAENDIFASIIDDLKAFNKKPEQIKISLEPTIEALKEFQNNQTDTQKQMDSLTEFLQSFREEQENQVDLDSIIKDLESFDKKSK